jgi:small-conductance mechanosensitive channel
VLIVELGLGAAVAAGLRRRQPMASITGLGGRAWQRGLALWLRLAVVAFAAGIPAAVLGYVALANMLAGAPVLGSFMGTALLVVVLVLELLLRALVGTGALDRVHLIRTQHGALLRGAAWLLRAAAVGAWLYLILDFTTLGDPLWPWIGQVLGEPIGYGSVSITLGGALAFFLAIWLSWTLARLSAFVLDTEVFPRVRMPPGVPFALATFTRYAVLFVGFVVALGLVGFSLDRVTILVGALGVGVGFGLQNVVNNFVSGVVLLFERPIRVGDRIQLEDLVGDVTQIGIRASRVRTLDGIDLIVPNADFISARVANWTLADHARRVSLPVGVAYGTPPRSVLELLQRVARAHPEVLSSPAPEALFCGFGDSSLNFELRVWTDGRLIYRVQSDIAVATHDALEEAGIAIPFPQRDLHLRSVAPEAAGALPRGAREDENR